MLLLMFNTAWAGLPVKAYTLNKHKLNLEVATTAEQFETGLMYRESLPKDGGMIFLFKKPMTVTFWMKNCKIPLDMIFIKNRKVVKIIHNAPPCKQSPCPLFYSSQSVDSVIEVNGGQALKWRIKAGHTLKAVNSKALDKKP